nr:UDP-N-acetylmuramate dehydrogenase [Skermania piniformis]
MDHRDSGRRLADTLRSAGARVRADVALAELTTLRVGGPVPLLAECDSAEVLVETLRVVDAAGIPTLLVAGGSNLLIGDRGFPGVAVRIANAELELSDDRVVAGAGAVWDEVVAATVAAGAGGLECLSGIPGSAGATPVQNVGAYGVEVASLLRRVRLLDRRAGVVRWVTPDELGFGYRTSVLKRRDDAVVLAVEFALRPDGSSAPLRYGELARRLDAADGARRPAGMVRDAVLTLRRGKAMLLDPDDHDTWSVGSFFTNPVVPAAAAAEVLATIRARVGDIAIPQYPAAAGTKLSAGWLIEQAGFGKGFPGPAAPARLSTKHTLALTNRGTASAADLVELARTVRAGVAAAFGVTLEPEPVLVGVTVEASK